MSNREELLKKIHGFIKHYEKRVKLILIVLVTVIALIFAGAKVGIVPVGTAHLDQKDVQEKIEENRKKKGRETKEKPANIKQVTVDISGRVQNPGVYTVPEGSRLNDIIERAGGLLDDADLDAINRAENVQDGQKLYIPQNGEESPNVAGQESQTASSGGKININRADSTELQQINGVGPATAEKIIEYRKVNGRFNSIEDIQNVSGIGEKTFEKIKDSITV